MTDNSTERARFETMWKRLNERLTEAGVSPAAISRHITSGRNSGYVGDLNRNKNGKEFRFPEGELGRRLAETLQVNHAWLLALSDAPPPPLNRLALPPALAKGARTPAMATAEPAPADLPALLPLVGWVRAGAWIESDSVETNRDSLLPPLPGLPIEAQFALAVFGDSLNELVPDGAQLHVIDAERTGYTPCHGDIVLVERRRGQLIERTVKEVRFVGAGRMRLVARSLNPEWSGEIDLGDGEDAVRIVGRVRRYAGEL